MSLKSRCYLAVCTTNQQRMKKRLLKVPGVYRVTDHGPHLKINTTKLLPKIRGLHVVLVKDRTTHWDVRFWDFATDAFRHAVKKKRDPEKAVAVMVHYLYNLFGLPEAEHLAVLAARRKYIDATVSDEEAHGWELPHVQKLRKGITY